MTEHWKPIPGYEDAYKVSSEGRVASVRHGVKLLVQTDHATYAKVSLALGGSTRTENVHRLVARAFLGDAGGRVVRHLDGNSKNNRLDNLAYGTTAENNLDTIHHGHNRNAAKRECHNGHPFDHDNTYVWHGSRHCRACRRDRKRNAGSPS